MAAAAGTPRHVEVVSFSPGLDPRIAASIEFMRGNLSQPLRISQVARTVGLSHSRFCSLFQSQVGIRPKQALTRLRVKHARWLLLSTRIHTKEIAAMVGLTSMSTFMRLVKVTYGMTAGQIRETRSDCSAIAIIETEIAKTESV